MQFDESDHEHPRLLHVVVAARRGGGGAAPGLSIMKLSTLVIVWRPRARVAIMACRPAVGPIRRAAPAPGGVRPPPSVGLSPPPDRRPDRFRQADPGAAVRLLLRRDRRHHLLGHDPAG